LVAAVSLSDEYCFVEIILSFCFNKTSTSAHHATVTRHPSIQYFIPRAVTVYLMHLWL